MNRSLLAAITLALLLVSPSLPVHADPIISVGAPLAPGTPFVVPIEITGAVNLVTWQFDLSFDPTELQIVDNCDPFTDPFCNFNGFGVTEGPFPQGPFGSLFIPGVPNNIDGDLTIVAGATFEPLGKTGDGILAYVQFIALVANPTSPITVDNATTTSTSIPEPTTLLLLASGFAFLSGRGLIKRRRRTDS